MADVFNIVIWHLSKDEYEHCSDVAVRCGYHSSTVRKALVSLYNGDLVERKIDNRKYFYRNKQQRLPLELG